MGTRPSKLRDQARELLVRYQAEQGLSNRQVGRRAGIDPSTVDQFRSGKITPSLDTFEAMLGALGLEPVLTVRLRQEEEDPPLKPEQETCGCDTELIPGTFGALPCRRIVRGLIPKVFQGQEDDWVVCEIADAQEIRFVSRCDVCRRYEGDLEAAQALADRFGGRVHYRRSPEDPDIIAYSTAPWIVLGDEPGPPVHHHNEE